MKIGVIIGRFQVPELTPGHKEFIKQVQAENDTVIVLIGQNDARNTKRNPLPYESVKQLLFDFDKNLITNVIYDSESNEYWSECVDKTIKKMTGQSNHITLYGGRDSFIPFYSGEFKTKELKNLLKPGEEWSGTKVREQVGEPMTKEAREGAIWAANFKWPTMYQVVDAVVLNANGQVLMCRKEGCVQWGLIGGFVDPEDETLEGAVKREVKEETGLDINPEYQFSLKIPDRRYTKELDKVMSHVFLCTLAENCFEPKPMDDIVETKWFNRLELPEVIPAHREMLKKLGMGLKEKL